MHTSFTDTRRRNTEIGDADAILRKCVRCGFCSATCPSYQITANELDSPRGRIYLIKEMLESDKPPDADVVRHIDRCLGCMACKSACPSGLDYERLLEIGRAHIEQTYKRPANDRFRRWLIRTVFPFPKRLRLAATLGRVARPVAGLFPGLMGTLLRALPRRFRKAEIPPQSCGTRGAVLLLTGCVQKEFGQHIHAATVRLLNRLGYEVIMPPAAGCCGALTHHLGDPTAKDRMKRLLQDWSPYLDRPDLCAIVVNASGCGSTVKNFGRLFASDSPYERLAAQVSGLARDISEFLDPADITRLSSRAPQRVRVAYHSACSLTHGLRIPDLPTGLLRAAGFDILEPQEQGLCCGSAGTYSLLEPALANDLKERKSRHLAALSPDVIVSGNLGCSLHLKSTCQAPIVHTAEMLDWATGGPKPF